MANSSNNVNFIGRLTRDPELKITSGGVPTLRFTLAVPREFKTKDGRREADFPTCVAWRGQAESMAKYLKKGSLVAVNGRLQTNRYEREDGTFNYTQDVIAESVQFLDSKSNDNQNQQQNPNFSGQQNQQYQQNPNFSGQQNQQYQQQQNPNFGGQQNQQQNPNFGGQQNQQQNPNFSGQQYQQYTHVGGFGQNENDLPF